jgi:hypothetical protein
MSERQGRSKEKEELIRELDSRKDSGLEFEGFVPVKARVNKNPRAVMSLRMSSEELREISEAARVYGQNMSEFVREAAVRAARQTRAAIELAAQRAG